MRRSRSYLGLTLFAPLAFAACADDPLLVVARCQADLECGPGKVCEAGACVPKDAVSCSAVAGGQAILQPGPPVVDFGEVGAASETRQLVLRNIGSCTLTLFEGSLGLGASSPFRCDACGDDERFPIELFPFRETTVELGFTPGEIGRFSDDLVLLSDDAEYPEVHIPVHARYAGSPDVIAQPPEVDFGFLAQGRTTMRNVQLTNRGTGTAKLEVIKVEIVPSTTTAFELGAGLPDGMGDPARVDPLSVDRRAAFDLPVLYHPRDVGRHHAEIVVTTNDQRKPTYRIPIRGTSETPAKIAVSPDEVRLGPVPIGRTNALPLTIVNEGGSPLIVRYRWGGTALSTDLSAVPQIIPPIEPGQYSELQVLVTATSVGPISGLLILESNDPLRPTVTVPVSADGQDVLGAQVVKIDMSFENADDSYFSNDFRNVDMMLENPFGLVCGKNDRNPTNWGSFGTPTWIGLGATEEPERIVLVDAAADGTYRVMLQYAEDCASLPSALASSILGIGVDVLIAATLGATIPGVNGSAISDVFDQICLDHAGTAVTLSISVNGQVVAEVPTRLARKGDYTYAVDLVRQGGQFTVR